MKKYKIVKEYDRFYLTQTAGGYLECFSKLGEKKYEIVGHNLILKQLMEEDI